MKSAKRSRQDAAFTLLEVLITIVIIGITTGTIALFQRNTWSSTRRTNNTTVAGQLIERQVELMRINIEIDSTTYWPPTDGDTTYEESGITVGWTVNKACDPDGVAIDEVRSIEYMATWEDVQPETLTVTTALSRDF